MGCSRSSRSPSGWRSAAWAGGRGAPHPSRCNSRNELGSAEPILSNTRRLRFVPRSGTLTGNDTQASRYWGSGMLAMVADRQAKAFDRRWAILGVLCLSLLVIVVDNSILNVALPTLVRDLHASNSQLQWMVDSYTLVFAGLLLTAGSLGDRFGRRGALQIGLAIFGLGSLASAFATTPAQLISTRALMGIGGAFIMPSTLSIITNVFPEHERGRAIGIWASVAGVAAA